MPFIFWAVFALLVLSAVILSIRLLVRKGVNHLISKSSAKADENFQKEFRAAPASDQKVQDRLNLLFYSRWVLQVLGILLFLLPLALLIGAGEAGMFLDELLPYVLLGGLGILLFVGGYLLHVKTKRLTGLLTEPMLREIFGDDMEYDAFSHIPDACIASSGFVDGYEDIGGSDFVRGQYRGISVMFSDIKLTRTDYDTDSDTGNKTEQVVVLFQGFWVVADFDRELTAVPLSVLEKSKGSNAIQMENEAFNRQFGVFCSDPHTAFYILTPHFMERLIAADQAANGKSCFKFAGNRLQIAIKTGHDLFEAGKWSAPNVKKLRTRFQQEIRNVTGILDEMLRHERLFGERVAAAGKND